MGLRRLARELVLNVLYSIDICSIDIDDAQRSIWGYYGAGKKVTTFANQLLKGTLDNISTIDRLLAEYAENWEINRMASIDRNILRQSIYELLYLKDIPINVVINEAVELAKKYSTVDSGKFVNGILDKVKEAQKVTRNQSTETRKTRDV